MTHAPCVGMHAERCAVVILCMCNATECYCIHDMTEEQEAYLERGTAARDVGGDGYLACVVLGKAGHQAFGVSEESIQMASLASLDPSGLSMVASSYNTAPSHYTFHTNTKFFILHK